MVLLQTYSTGCRIERNASSTTVTTTPVVPVRQISIPGIPCNKLASCGIERRAGDVLGLFLVLTTSEIPIDALWPPEGGLECL